MSDQSAQPTPPTAPEPPPPVLAVEMASSPHLGQRSFTSRRIMLDVLIALAAPLGVALWVFGPATLRVVAVCVVSCVAAEALFTWMRGKSVTHTLGDLSAVVTGMILALSLPWNTPIHVAAIGAFAAIAIGKAVFGGLGQNIFNPAMVGRAFVMLSFPLAIGAAGYVATTGMDAVTHATPLTAAKQLGEHTRTWVLLLGNHNGSLGEVSAIACLLGGLYLCVRRTASWQIPVGVLLPVVAIAGLGQLLAKPDVPLFMLRLTVLEHLLSGALLFGAFFIATDPVSGPLTALGKFIFGLGIGVFIMVIRIFSGYPEGVMFAVLMMNGFTPLIDRWLVPVPVGGRVPAPAPVAAAT